MNWLTLAGALAALARALAILLASLRLDRKAGDDASNMQKSRNFNRLVKALRARNRAVEKVRKRKREAQNSNGELAGRSPDNSEPVSPDGPGKDNNAGEPDGDRTGADPAASGLHDDKYRRED